MSPTPHTVSWRRRALALAGAVTLGLSMMATTAANADEEDDPRIDLTPGLHDAGQAASNMNLLSATPLAAPITGINSDLAYFGDFAINGNYNGFQIFDVSDPAAPTLRTQVLCPGSQNDVSVYGNLLFLSVESTAGRIDCGTQGTGSGNIPNADRFRGVRIFDISNVDNPVQVGGVQTCRGSHTHTLVADPDDTENIYIYNSGTAGVRSATELPGCVNQSSNTQDPVTSGDPAQWRIDVIKVPLANPAAAAVVSQPRIFTNTETGAYNGLQNTLSGTPHPSGTNYSPVPNTNTCHDITAYPEIGLAAGACQGNGILLDISDPVNPVRLDAVADPNFSYWHSATFNNDGTKVIFTDEWGGGSGARCRITDKPEWGANALFDIVDGKMQFASYYKLPVPQSPYENCVAHNGSLVPVPGRDIMVQAWYQGGVSVFDFTDTKNPVEIAFFDRGPVAMNNNSAGNPIASTGGYWSTYWYNGNIFGSDLTRGFDSLELTSSEQLTANELAAALEIQSDEVNVQMQERYVHAPSFAVTRAYIDQAERDGSLSGKALDEVRKHVDQAEQLAGTSANSRALIAQLDNAVRKSGQPDSAVVQALNELKASLG